MIPICGPCPYVPLYQISLSNIHYIILLEVTMNLIKESLSVPIQKCKYRLDGQKWLSPCWSVLDFWKKKLCKSSSTNWIFSLQKLISKLIFAGYTGSKIPVRNRLKIQSIKLDFSKLIFQKTSTDQLCTIYSNHSKYLVGSPRN